MELFQSALWQSGDQASPGNSSSKRARSCSDKIRHPQLTLEDFRLRPSDCEVGSQFPLRHVSTSIPANQNGQISRVRFWPRLCMPFSDIRPSLALRNQALARMLPAPHGSTSASSRPVFRSCPVLSPAKIYARRTAECQSIFAWFGRYQNRGDDRYRLKGHYYFTFIAHTGPRASPATSIYLSFSYMGCLCQPVN